MTSVMVPSVVDRYYKRFYACDLMEKQNEDICLMFHSNHVCVITLAPSHPIVAEQKLVTDIDYKISDKLDRRDNKVSGKAKRGAQFLTCGSILCRATCSDGSVYAIRACFNGRLLEVNENLQRVPQLLTSKTESDGYLAIAFPTRKNDFVNGPVKLLNRLDYLKLRFPDVVDANIVANYADKIQLVQAEDVEGEGQVPEDSTATDEND